MLCVCLYAGSEGSQSSARKVRVNTPVWGFAKIVKNQSDRQRTRGLYLRARAEGLCLCIPFIEENEREKHASGVY